MDLDRCPLIKANIGPAAFVARDGTITVFARHFTNGKDGSTFFNAAFTYGGAAPSFTNPLEFKKNGPRVSQDEDGIDELVVVLPVLQDTDCINGECSVIFKSVGEWGNCVRVLSDGVTSGKDVKPINNEGQDGIDEPAGEETGTASATASPQAPTSTAGVPVPKPSGSNSGQCRRKRSTGAVGRRRLHARDFLSMFRLEF